MDPNRVMAAFVYRFPQFVEWPAVALQGRDTMDICVAEPDPFGEVLQQLAEGDQLNGRALKIRTVDRAAGLPGCHVLFLSRHARQAADMLHTVRDLPVLTVGDAPDFLADGGVIGMEIIDHRVRFEVSTEAAQRAGLLLSSQLLALAVSVRGSLP